MLGEALGKADTALVAVTLGETLGETVDISSVGDALGAVEPAKLGVMLGSDEGVWDKTMEGGELDNSFGRILQ